MLTCVADLHKISQESRRTKQGLVVELRRRCCFWSVATLILSGVCIAACAGESAPPTQKPPESPAAPPAQSAAPVSRQAQPPSSGTTGKRQAPPVAPTTKPKKAGGDRGERVTKTFAVYTLSRGKGVPPEAREAQQKVEKLVEADRERGVSVSVETTRIGIEGERRLCVTYENSRDGVRALDRIRAIVKGVDLVNLVEEPCKLPPSKSPKKEEPS